LDSEFHVERPTRALRQGLRAIHLEDKGDEEDRDKDDGRSAPIGRRLVRPFHRHENHGNHNQKEGEDREENDEHTDHENDGGHHRAHTEPNEGSSSTQTQVDHDHDNASHRKHVTDLNQKEPPSTPRSKSSLHPRRSSVSTAKSTILGRLRSIRSGREGSRRRSSSSESVTSHNSDSSAESDMAEPAYKDPSTHVNIMTNKHTQGDADDTGRDKGKEKDLSHHTFFIENSQMRLKLVARTEVKSTADLLRIRA
jgi:hypothetical protein